MGEFERQQGGKRRQQGERHDEFMSHIIDWQPRCGDCGNRFSLGAGETGRLHRGPSLSFILKGSSWPVH